jgi:hypothetical protein
LHFYCHRRPNQCAIKASGIFLGWEKSPPDIKSMAQKKLRVPEHLSARSSSLRLDAYVMPAGVALGHGGDQILLPPHYSQAEEIQHLHLYGIS